MTPVTFCVINIILISAVSSVIPWFTRRDLFFSTTVPTYFRTAGAARRILRQYLLSGWIGTAALAALIVSFAAGGRSIQTGIAGAIAVWIGAFLIARHGVSPFAVSPNPVRSAALAPRIENLPGGIAGIVIPFLFLAAKGIEYHARWTDIPDRFPVHWGLNGPDRWMDRTPVSVYGSLLGVAVECAAMMLTAWAIVHASRHVHTTGANAGPERRFRRIGAAGLMALAYAFAFTLPPMPNMYLNVPYAPVLIICASIALVVSLAVAGQSRNLPAPAGTARVGDGTPDAHWRFGLIYFNRSDPAVLVEKRFGLGWTFNFAHPVSWIVIIAFLGWPLLMVIAR